MTKICIVTGASQGLGRGIAKVLAEEESATVYATARSEQALNELASSIKGNGTIHPFVLDQNDDSAVEQFVSQVSEKEKQIDVLVISANHSGSALFLFLTPQSILVLEVLT